MGVAAVSHDGGWEAAMGSVVGAAKRWELMGGCDPWRRCEWQWKGSGKSRSYTHVYIYRERHPP